MEAKKRKRVRDWVNQYADADAPYFWMTDSELKVSYLQAANRTNQVRVLAELNARSINDTVGKLQSLGLDVDVRGVATSYGACRRTWKQKEVDRMMLMRSEGHTWREIGYALCRSRQTVQNKYLRITSGKDKHPCKN